MKRRNNEVSLSGVIIEDFKFESFSSTENFYMTKICIQRESGACDELPVMVSDQLIDVYKDWKYESVFVKGEYRSRKHNGHLILYVFAECIGITRNLSYENSINLNGFIRKKPTCRKTPFGREISDILFAVNRVDGRSDYIPCIAWWKNAKIASSLEVGTRLNITGRIQSREYRKKISEDEYETRTAYEVSVSKMEVIDNADSADKKDEA